MQDLENELEELQVLVKIKCYHKIRLCFTNSVTICFILLLNYLKLIILSLFTFEFQAAHAEEMESMQSKFEYQLKLLRERLQHEEHRRKKVQEELKTLKVCVIVHLKITNAKV